MHVQNNYKISNEIIVRPCTESTRRKDEGGLASRLPLNPRRRFCLLRERGSEKQERVRERGLSERISRSEETVKATN